jgi:mono/diheme cytochrome c family protein
MFGDEASRTLSGGAMDNWFAANLTGDRADGLGKWSVPELTRYFATGRNQYATAAGDMEEKVTLSTSRMTDSDRDAIAQFLKTLAPARATAPLPPDPGQIQRGEAIFVARCEVCHDVPDVPDALSQGGLPAYPKLGGDSLVVGRDPTTVLHILISGAQSPVTTHERVTFSMPAFPVMSDGETADVATYIRNSWGNRAPSVRAGQVGRLRAAIAAAPPE